MSHEEDKDPPKDSNDFAEKFEAILFTLFEEYKKKEDSSRKLTDRQKYVAHCLQEFIVSGGLKLDKSAADTTSLCDGFISDWESTGIKSAAVQQLIALLNRPHVRGALISAEDIAANRYMPKLPAVPFEVDEDEGIAVKVVRIVKRDETLGATIKCEHGKVYIARLIAGGVAVRSACIQEGDRILEVNGLPIADLSVDDVARILNRVDCGTVTLKLVPAELPYSTTTNGISHVYLRAQGPENISVNEVCGRGSINDECVVPLWFQKCHCGEFDDEDEESRAHRYAIVLDELVVLVEEIACAAVQECAEELDYDYNGRDDVRHPCPEVALSFSKGDILELLVCNDDHWWQARCIGNGAFATCENSKASSRIGLIPSEALQLLKNTVENDLKGDGRGSTRSRGSQEMELIYESVCRMSLRDGFSRVIVLVGAPGVGRANEIEGVDYYFVERSVMEKMIYSGQMLEFGEYRGNLYGTALCSVRGAQKFGTPLITPHPLALQLLRTPEFMPFIIFIKPPDAAAFKDTRIAGPNTPRTSTTSSKRKFNISRTFSDAEIEQIINNSVLLHKQYGHLFDAVIVNEDFEESFTQLIRLINDLETKPTWVPLCWATNIRFD
ncbi:unnamed protein product [Angiostrongylus costaricensis]|uniref:MAGUK p55 subfamily member 7 n=1 Tax=Angiostrongylus costaricensis TaxID=334426 RepID=A0A158PH51_ANGCS|nr:unnamed protein product [Angiostrongylus costaricensis]